MMRAEAIRDIILWQLETKGALTDQELTNAVNSHELDGPDGYPIAVATVWPQSFNSIRLHRRALGKIGYIEDSGEVGEKPARGKAPIKWQLTMSFDIIDELERDYRAVKEAGLL